VSAMRKVPDPYRVLGVARGADAAQIKAAHRRLAKRHHPDAPGGDEDRFVAVQDAYQLLSDPLRRREWDRSHAPGPVDARDRGSRASARAASSRWTREEAGGAYRRTRTTRGATGASRRDDAASSKAGAGNSGHDPGARRKTWSAEGVPWWEDFTPKGGAATAAAGQAAGEQRAGQAAAEQRAAGQAAAEQRAAGQAAAEQHAAHPRGAHETRLSGDMDAFSRSSGAAWSSAARRHFRRDEATLPSRGAFRYRGTQIVTGAEARKVAEEEAAAQAAAAALFRRAQDASEDRPAPRAFDHDEPVARPPVAPAPRRGPGPSHRDAPGPAVAAGPRQPAAASQQAVASQPAASQATSAASPSGQPATRRSDALTPDRPAPARLPSDRRDPRRPGPERESAGAGPVVAGAVVATAITAIPVLLGASAGAIDPTAPAAIGALLVGAFVGGVAGWLLARIAPRVR
jgi:curved DNA-binding protein CbpA